MEEMLGRMVLGRGMIGRRGSEGVSTGPRAEIIALGLTLMLPFVWAYFFFLALSMIVPLL